MYFTKDDFLYLWESGVELVGDFASKIVESEVGGMLWCMAVVAFAACCVCMALDWFWGEAWTCGATFSLIGLWFAAGQYGITIPGWFYAVGLIGGLVVNLPISIFVGLLSLIVKPVCRSAWRRVKQATKRVHDERDIAKIAKEYDKQRQLQVSSE